MTRTAHHIKRLLFLVIIIILLTSKQGFSQQCDIDYYVAGNPNDTCLVAGNDITLINSANVGWNIVDEFNTSIYSNFSSPGLSNTTWPSVPSGIYTIQTYTYTGPIWSPWEYSCSSTITIAPGVLSLPDDTLSYCQWNTINLVDILNTYHLQNGTTDSSLAIYPVYTCSLETYLVDISKTPLCVLGVTIL